MLDSRGFWYLLRRRSKQLAASILLATCLLILYTRSDPQIGYHLTHRQSFATVPTPSTQSVEASIVKQLEDWEEPRPIKGNGASVQQAALGQIPPANVGGPIIPVIIFAFNRSDHLRRTIESVLSSASYSPSLHPIFVSQDGDNFAVAETIQSYGQKVRRLQYHWSGKTKKFKLPSEYLPSPGGVQLPPGSRPPTPTPYLKIAGHYKFALTEVMDRVEGHDRWDRLIMLEDDMDVSPDFFSYFRRMSPLLDQDPSLYCVSAWNDHGQSNFVREATALHRTDCFPGLGWMWSRALWDELREWTPGWWDDWLREPAQRKGRSCIYPEVSRVFTFGTEGTSTGWFFDPWLREMQLNEQNVDWDAIDIEYLHQRQYDDVLKDQVRSAIPAKNVDEARQAINRDLARGAQNMTEAIERVVRYKDLSDLTMLMMTVGLLYEHKAGVPRTSYQGIVHFRHRGIRIWAVPEGFETAVD